MTGLAANSTKVWLVPPPLPHEALIRRINVTTRGGSGFLAENSAPIGEWYGLSKAEIKIGGCRAHFREKLKNSIKNRPKSYNGIYSIIWAKSGIFKIAVA